MTLRCLIVDDEPLAHRVILKYAADLPELEIIGQCHLATEALSFLRREKVDLLFLDINMPRLNGLDFLRSLRSPPAVVVTSAYEEYALESFDLDVVDYLHKPFRFDRFLRAVNKVTAKMPAVDVETRSHIFVKSDKRTVSIVIEDIDYLESYGNYVKIHQGASYVLTPATLTSLTAGLPADRFIRIHKSYTINWREIDYTEGNTVFLKSGSSLPVGKSYRAGFKRFFR